MQPHLDGTLLDGSGLQESIVRTCELLAESQPDLIPGRWWKQTTRSGLATGRR